MASGAPSICEASFVADGVFIAVDFLERLAMEWTVVEVKSTLAVKENLIPDVPVQLHVLRASGGNAHVGELMQLDRTCTFPNLSNLFARDDVTSQTEALLPELPVLIRRMRDALEGALPAVDVGPHCDDPQECPFKARCWPEVPEHHVSTLYRGGKTVAALKTRGT